MRRAVLEASACKHLPEPAPRRSGSPRRQGRNDTAWFPEKAGHIWKNLIKTRDQVCVIRFRLYVSVVMDGQGVIAGTQEVRRSPQQPPPPEFCISGVKDAPDTPAALLWVAF